MLTYISEMKSLPFFETTLNDCGYNCNCTSCDTNGEVENKVNVINRKGFTVDNCTKWKNKCCVNNVCANNVTN